MFIGTLKGVELHEHINGPGRSIPTQASGARPKVSLVIPTLKESENLQCPLPTIGDIVDELVIVDCRSIGGTVETALSLRPGAVIVRERRAGKGYALQAGFAACSGDIIGMMGADGSMAPAEIETFLDARALAAGLHIVGVASYEERRINSESNLSATREGYSVLSTVVRERRRVRRYRAGRGPHRPALHSCAPMSRPVTSLRDHRASAPAAVPAGPAGSALSAVAVAAVIPEEDRLGGARS